MKRLIKQFLRATWRMAAPLRQPIVRKIDNHANLILNRAIEAQVLTALNAIEAQMLTALNQVDHSNNVLAFEMNLVLNSLVREVTRLQMQVEVLRQSIEDTAQTASGLSIVGEGEDNQPCHASA